MRRRAAEVERISRWQREVEKFRVSIDKSLEFIKALDYEIYELGCERNRRLQAIQHINNTGSAAPDSGHQPRHQTESNVQDDPTVAGDTLWENPSRLQGVDSDTTINPEAPFAASIASSSVTSSGAAQVPLRESVQGDGSNEVNDRLHFAPLPPEVSADILESQQPRFELVERSNLMYGLPMTFEGNSGPATVMAVPDSGSDYNVMSQRLALHLGPRLEWDSSEETRIEFLDRSTTVCATVVRARCRFAKTFDFDWKMRCTFLVLPSLVGDLIMSASFLEKTATFTTFRNRLVKMSLRTPRLPRVCAMGPTLQWLTCCIDGEAVEALPDSGSDVDVISLSYATKRGFKWQETSEHVMFADGRTQKACGIFSGQLCLGGSAQLVNINENNSFDEKLDWPADQQKEGKDDDNGDLSARTFMLEPERGLVQHVIRTTFYILDGISTNALIGAKLIESLHVFTRHSRYLSSPTACALGYNSLHRITLKSKMRSCFQSVLHSSRLRTPETPAPSLEDQFSDADQQENARREEADLRASRLTGEERVVFDREEDSMRRAYEEYRAYLLQAWIS
ncbi:hypothetical protein OPT61_g9626 [Boeremia exigua]|uniref:Uncharacterized protein n=1 Tax=Boeremia exigua TaxID=749465 RepID=A0ACC2HTE8_9PLEO|nr:hypothetical protein OPT61_g9626 [Boeremia exigua]